MLLFLVEEQTHFTATKSQYHSHVRTSHATITSYFSGLQLYDHKKSFPHTAGELQKQLACLKSISSLKSFT